MVEIFRLPLFGDNDVSNIQLSNEEVETIKYLEAAIRKSLLKPILKPPKKGKTTGESFAKSQKGEKVLDNTVASGDKGSRANFWGWIRYFWRGHAHGMDEEVDNDTLKEGVDYMVGEGKSGPYELEAFIAFLLSRHLFEGYANEKILDLHFPLAIKLAKGILFLWHPTFMVCCMAT